MFEVSPQRMLEGVVAALGERCRFGLLLTDAGGRIIAINHRLCEFFESPIDTDFWVGADASDLFTRMSGRFDDPEGFLDGVAYLELNGVAVHEESLTLASGRALERDFIPLLVDGERQGVLWAFRLRGAADADHVHTYYHRVLEALPAQLAVFSMTGTYDYVTPSAIADPDTRAWIIGRTDVEYGRRRGLPPEMVAARRARVLECAASGRPSEFEESFTARDGQVRHYRRYVSPVLGPDGTVTQVLGYGLDITKQRRAEQELLQAQKLDAVGRLAGGIAHDFNNLLTVIGGYTEMTLDELDEGHPGRQSLGVVVDAVRNASALVRQIMAFSRNTAIERAEIDLDVVVKQTVSMARRLVGEHVRVRVEQSSGAKPVNGDAGQMQQVIMNLLVNARDAMPEGGDLSLSTNTRTLGAADEAIYQLSPGTYCTLTVSDTGVGMTDEVKRRLFEPFFTTKDVGRGTGLGLSIVYGIVTDWGGRVVVDSAPGAGTRVQILLPRSVPSARPLERSHGPTAGLPRGQETVLVVEDDPDILELVRVLLVSLGYQTLTATDGMDARDVARQYHGSIDLLVSDVVMPGMSGAELARHLLVERPDMRVLFASGYFDDVAVRDAITTHGAAFIAKPFKVPDLARRIRRLLDTPREGEPPAAA